MILRRGNARGAQTRAKIIEQGFTLALLEGLQSVTRNRVATEAGVPKNTINHHFGGAIQFRREIALHAVATGSTEEPILQIVRDALLMRVLQGNELSRGLKTKALAL